MSTLFAFASFLTRLTKNENFAYSHAIGTHSSSCVFRSTAYNFLCFSSSHTFDNINGLLNLIFKWRGEYSQEDRFCTIWGEFRSRNKIRVKIRKKRIVILPYWQNIVHLQFSSPQVKGLFGE